MKRTALFFAISVGGAYVGLGEPMVEIEIIPTSGVSSASPSYPGNAGNRQNIMLGLTGNAVITDRTLTPAAWHRIGYFEWGDMALSKGFNSFRGKRNPSGVFAGEFGNRAKWCVRVRSTNGEPFSANQVWFTIASTRESLDLTGNIATNSSSGTAVPYQFILQGLNYGPNKAKGDGDDIWYRSDARPAPPETLVHELSYIGVTTAYTASGDPVSLGDVRDAVVVSGFQIGITYYLKVGANIRGYASKILDSAPRLEIRKEKPYVVVTLLGQPGFAYDVQRTLAIVPTVSWSALPGPILPGMSSINGPALLPHEFFRVQGGSLIGPSAGTLAVSRREIREVDGYSANGDD